ncbi:hypothetical protein D3C79_1044270 [compost metagenome]
MLGTGKIMSFRGDPVEIGLSELKLICAHHTLEHIAPIGTALVLPAIDLPALTLAYFSMSDQFMATGIFYIEMCI